MLQASKILYQDKQHQLIWISWQDPDTQEQLIPTNQILVVNGDQGYLFDPGSSAVFSEVAAEVSKYLPLGKLRYLLASHQDPDVISATNLWLKASNARLLISKLWLNFISHQGFSDFHRLIAIEDQGKKIKLPAGGEIILLPAHFLHSAGNFSFYDTRSRVLFSGDIGSSIFPSDVEPYVTVEDLDEHLGLMQDYHLRYMGNNAALRKWVSQVRQYDIDMLVPQHGASLQKHQIAPFLDWLENLYCGTDLLEKFYGF